ncbi:hypothetical protein [Rubrivivax rivuli]|uniref:Lipoprotein n=1 Tax=Rubrivivax rivuli TaxID=1862385 RepID=A0A437RE23_9BURK|nr:hypothetical protein [Rubrivivax rivuli]RVU45009.1 hypothetical protein EOE66_12660 [Rubrivivax rivuli]
MNPILHRRWRNLGLALGTGLLSACVVVPQTREVYDADCKVMKRQMTLQTAQLGGFQSCGDDACKALLVAAGAVTAASAVVSGSVALVGNMIFWFERQGQCARVASPPPTSPAGTSAAAPAAGAMAAPQSEGAASAPALPN